jgi:predicted phosphate transport protein (TIGR00153 family)
MAVQLFKRTKQLEFKVDEILDLVSQSGMAFEQAIDCYLSEGVDTHFNQRVDQLVSLETRGDELGLTVELELYHETLIPDARGDVLTLLEALDGIINSFKGILFYFSTETPEIPDDLRQDFNDLAKLSCAAVEALVLAARAFFRDVQTVNDHIHKVHYYEKEADVLVTKLRREIFQKDLPLANKIHLRFFAERIVWISDMAEEVADKLTIYAIKRTI